MAPASIQSGKDFFENCLAADGDLSADSFYMLHGEALGLDKNVGNLEGMGSVTRGWGRLWSWQFRPPPHGPIWGRCFICIPYQPLILSSGNATKLHYELHVCFEMFCHFSADCYSGLYLCDQIDSKSGAMRCINIDLLTVERRKRPKTKPPSKLTARTRHGRRPIKWLRVSPCAAVRSLALASVGVNERVVSRSI